MGDLIRLPRTRRRPLWREALGHELRRERVAQGRTQGDVAETAGISTQYLSEIERGRKEPSSEILEATADALRLDLAELARRAADRLAPMAPLVPLVPLAPRTADGPTDDTRFDDTLIDDTPPSLTGPVLSAAGPMLRAV